MGIENKAKDEILKILKEKFSSSYESLVGVTGFDTNLIWESSQQLADEGYAEVLKVAVKTGRSFIIKSTPKGILFIESGGFRNQQKKERWTNLEKHTGVVNSILGAIVSLVTIWGIQKSNELSEVKIELVRSKMQIDSLIRVVKLNNSVRSSPNRPGSTLITKPVVKQILK